jgi:sterol desaturase/sphingolipid hydroxylase (fatty acid hydroxylase superfamily)
MKKLFSNLFVNHFLLAPAFIGVIYLISVYSEFGIDTNYVNYTFTLKQTLFHLSAFVLMTEIFFYYSHRLLHHPLFYIPIHKLHHEFHSPIALAATYAHPVEFLFGNLFAVSVGPVLLRTPIYLYWLWIVISTIGTLYHHCGYLTPFHIPFDHEPEFHDFHHESFMCMFSLFSNDSLRELNDKKYKSLYIDKSINMLLTKYIIILRYPNEGIELNDIKYKSLNIVEIKFISQHKLKRKIVI